MGLPVTAEVPPCVCRHVFFSESAWKPAMERYMASEACLSPRTKLILFFLRIGICNSYLSPFKLVFFTFKNLCSLAWKSLDLK